MSEEINTPAPPVEEAKDNPPVETVETTPPAEPPKDAPLVEEVKKEEPPKNEEKKLQSLLDDDEEPSSEEKKDDPSQPSEEDIDAWVKSVPALDLGDGVRWDDAALKAMAPSLMGLEKGKADGVIKAYADYTKSVAKAQAEAADAFNRGLIAQCQERFGEDTKKVVALAKKGGVSVFGEQIWNEMKKVPAFANNPDIIERLAEVGRRIADDGGKVAPKGEAGGSEKEDLLHRMYGNVRV